MFADVLYRNFYLAAGQPIGMYPIPEYEEQAGVRGLADKTWEGAVDPLQIRLSRALAAIFHAETLATSPLTMRRDLPRAADPTASNTIARWIKAKLLDVEWAFARI